MNNGHSGLSEDKITEFLTQTELKRCKNAQNILLDGCYQLFEEYLQEKKHLFIALNLAREMGQSFKGSLRGSKLVKNCV